MTQRKKEKTQSLLRKKLGDFMPMDIGKYSDSEIQVALGVAIQELFSGNQHRLPYDFSAVRSEEVRLKLAESSDVEKHTAWFSPLLEKERVEGTLHDRSAAYTVERHPGWSCLDQKIKREAEETLLDSSAAYAVERQAGCSCLDQKIKGEAEETLLDRSAAYAVERQAGCSCLDQKIKREA